MLPHLPGSYEGCPPTLIDTAVRDRRWAQGNLQHLRIVGAAGLPWVSRLHLAMGTYAYFASVFWALSLLVGLALSVQSALTIPVYFTEQKTLFPVWPVIDPTKALYLFVATIAVVLLPKVLGIALAFIERSVAGRNVGWFLLGAVLEILLSILMAPIFMLTQTAAVLQILQGKDFGMVGAKARRRACQFCRFGPLPRVAHGPRCCRPDRLRACVLVCPGVDDPHHSRTAPLGQSVRLHLQACAGMASARAGDPRNGFTTTNCRRGSQQLPPVEQTPGTGGTPPCPHAATDGALRRAHWASDDAFGVARSASAVPQCRSVTRVRFVWLVDCG